MGNTTSTQPDTRNSSRKRFILCVFAVMTLAAVLTALLTLPGCRGLGKSGTSTSPSTELTKNPKILIDSSVPVTGLTLRGIRLGDPASAISNDLIESRGTGDWIVIDGSLRYRANEQGVYTLGIWNLSLVQKLGIEKEQDIVKLLGEPATVDTIEKQVGIYFRNADHPNRTDPNKIPKAEYKAYRYPSRGIDLFWNVTDEHLTAVNVYDPARPRPAASQPAESGQPTTK